MIKLSTDSLSSYFVIASDQNSHYQQPTNCFDFIDRESNDLLVTVGDSWSWGQKLSNRLEEVFGNRLSHYFGWDWLNLSQPGSSNFFIAEKVQELGAILSRLHYQRITIVCTFTEIGRAFNSHHDQHIDYRLWLDSNLVEPEDFYCFLEMLNQDCVKRISSAIDSRCQIVFGTNFVHNLALPSVNTLPMIWSDLLDVPYPVKVFASSTGVSRLKDIENFVPFDKRHLFKKWFVEMINQAKYVDLKWFDKKTHPNAQDHDKWANLIINYLS